MVSVLKRIRVRQIHFCARWLRRLCKIPAFFAVFKVVRELPVMHQALVALMGYRRPFPTLQAAAAAIAGYEGKGHDSPDYHAIKLAHARNLRPGDYAALFHLERILPQVRQVFDLGGSVGELFYCYLRYLEIPADFSWTVCDLPETNRRGREMAKLRQEHRLRFTDKLIDVRDADLLMIAGALHYLEKPLARLLAELPAKPRFIVVNRAPVVDGPAVATVEDGETYRLPCIYHNRQEFVAGLEASGYELVDSWVVRGRTSVIPGYPDRTAQYRGFFFRLRRASQARTLESVVNVSRGLIDNRDDGKHYGRSSHRG